MFHAAILKARDQSKVELLEWIIDSGIALDEVQCSSVKLEGRINIARDLLRIRFPVQQRDASAIDIAGYALELSGHKGKQIGTDEIGAGELQRLAAQVEFQRSGLMASQCSGITRVSSQVAFRSGW
ncbi:MAG: hypothetical protein ACE37N_09595 [Pseudohongiellaceae bacterium]